MANSESEITPFQFKTNPISARLISRIRYLFVFGLILCYLAACSVGRDFGRPPPAALELNKTTKQEILSRYGDPYKSFTQISNEHQVEHITYTYSARKDPHVAGVTPARALTVSFLDDVLIGYSFGSSFREDHTDFDETLVPRIKKGKDTCNDVVRMFGQPSGEQIFPLMKEPETKGLLYYYSHSKVGFASVDIYIKNMLVTCDEDGLVKEVEYTSTGQE